MSLRSAEHGTFLNPLFEVVLIAVGVLSPCGRITGTSAARHRAQAKADLRNFVGEMEANRQALAIVTFTSQVARAPPS